MLRYSFENLQYGVDIVVIVFTDRYRDLIGAAAEGGDADVVRAGEALGFLRGDEVSAARECFVEMTRVSAEPLCARGPYDFGRSQLGARVRDLTLAAYREHKLPRPPTGTLFLHRKLAGTFLLCGHIGATVDCRALYQKLIRD